MSASISAKRNYVPFVVEGDLLHISGQISRHNGRDDEGAQAARQSALGVVAQIVAATGDRLDRVARVVRLNVFIASTPAFSAQSVIANGASDVIVQIFGEAGRHARSAVGVASLPAGVAVEVEAVIALKNT